MIWSVFDAIPSVIEVSERWELRQIVVRPICPDTCQVIVSEIEVSERWTLRGEPSFCFWSRTLPQWPAPQPLLKLFQPGCNFR
jgi:hypothetical protein